MFSIPYTFFRYALSRNGRILSTEKQWNFLIDNIGKEVAYRKSLPSELDKDTAIIMPDKITLEGRDNLQIIYFSIAKHIITRTAQKYNRDADVVTREMVATDEYITGDMVAIPKLGLLAASDKSGSEDIPARSLVGRLSAIVKNNPTFKLEVNHASSAADLRTALAKWTLDEFTFSARPFNPSTSTPGDKLHALLVSDNAKIVGKAKPNKDGPLKLSDHGLLNEVSGLAERGYAQYGAVGQTTKGFHAKIEKSDPNNSTPPKIKVYIPIKENKEEHVKLLAETLIEINE